MQEKESLWLFSMQIKNGIGWDNSLASCGNPVDAERWPSWQNFQSALHNHKGFSTMAFLSPATFDKSFSVTLTTNDKISLCLWVCRLTFACLHLFTAPCIMTFSCFGHLRRNSFCVCVKSEDRYWSRILGSTIPIPVNYSKVKVTDLEFLCSIFTMSVLESFWWIWFEPKHDKTNKMTCVPSEDSDQPGHLSSLRVFAIRLKKVLVPSNPVWSESSLYARHFVLFCHALAINEQFGMMMDTARKFSYSPQYVT